ncbi:hypothetical protein BU14_0065s0033 [Porphyra umbilicalis]|uniref:Uncharacterized protein n=1 Tax=Porphyra umbilicalis TaxID=2786 RepID=A0A1X6PGY5_PORUM|nr:hypothetical protein BU14_0065s0033 [Porphyra umbilicalis]|eukprot:OSX80028.1 hypothetical protein BU14_0065s0033 [Porphyra umbilicalis]
MAAASAARPSGRCGRSPLRCRGVGPAPPSVVAWWVRVDAAALFFRHAAARKEAGATCAAWPVAFGVAAVSTTENRGTAGQPAPSAGALPPPASPRRVAVHAVGGRRWCGGGATPPGSAARVYTRLPHRSRPQLRRPQWTAVAAPSAAPQPSAVAAPHGPGVTAPSAEGATDAGSLPVEPPAPATQAGAAHTGQPARRAPRAHRAGLAPPRRAVAPHDATAVGRRTPTPPPSRLPGGGGRPHRRPPPPPPPARWTTALGGAACTRRRWCRAACGGGGGHRATGGVSDRRGWAGGGGAEASRTRVTVPQTGAAACELPARPSRARAQTRETTACGVTCPGWVPAAVRAPAAAGRRSCGRRWRLGAVGKGDGHPAAVVTATASRAAAAAAAAAGYRRQDDGRAQRLPPAPRPRCPRPHPALRGGRKAGGSGRGGHGGGRNRPGGGGHPPPRGGHRGAGGRR